MKTDSTKVALVLGATGGIGQEIAHALVGRGWRIRALTRDLERDLDPAFEWCAGDAMITQDVVQAAAGVRALVHAVNPPNYLRWRELALPMIDSSICAARKHGCRIVLPGTVYNFDPASTPVVHEDVEQNATGPKGRTRVELERRLENAAPQVRSLILRSGDFFGPKVRNSWFSQAVVSPGRPIRKITNPGRGVGHSWAYAPDLAGAVSSLLEQEDNLRDFERLQFEGFWDADGTNMTRVIREVAQAPAAKEAGFPWRLIRLLAPFSGMFKELTEVRQYWAHPMRFDNKRLIELLGTEPRTPIHAAVRETLTGLNCAGRAS